MWAPWCHSYLFLRAYVLTDRALAPQAGRFVWLPALQQSERDLPGDYNPPAREALIDLELGELDDALAASDRALAKVYGPRTVRVLELRAQILRKLERKQEARTALQRALTLAEGLPEGQKNPGAVERLQKALAALGPQG